MRAIHPPSPRLIGVVLAGGRATRFGSDKLATELAGRPLLHHAVKAVAGVAAEVMVALGTDASTPSLPELPVPSRIVRDRSADRGPLAGIAAALEAIDPAAHDGGAAILLVVAGDMPDLTVPLLVGLVESRGDADAAVLADGASWRPLPCVMRAEAARPLVRGYIAGDDRSIRAVLRDLQPVIVSEPAWRAWDPHGTWRDDVDRPSDLEAARQRR